MDKLSEQGAMYDDNDQYFKDPVSFIFLVIYLAINM